MKTSHTPEPWSFDVANFGNIRPANHSGKNICYFHRPEGKEEYAEGEANASRIVACVNGCKGVEDPEKTIPEILNIILEALPYVEESEEFNKPTRKGLSKRIKAALLKINK